MGIRVTAGIDVGGTKTAAVLISDKPQPLTSMVEPTNRLSSPRRIAEKIGSMIDHLLRNVQESRASLNAIGVGLPGLITPNRIFRDSIILPTWQNVNFEELLSSRLHVPILVDNDTTMAALGHFASISTQQRPGCLACVTLGTGVGGAILMDGKPLRGPDGTAGQIGHMIIRPKGRRCSCGNLGCLNAYSSGTAIKSRYVELSDRERTPPDGNIEETVDIEKLVNDGNPFMRTALNEAIEALITAFTSIVNLVNPEVIVIGGGVANLGLRILDPMRTVVAQQSFSLPANRVQIHKAAYGQLSGAMGAAISASPLAKSRK